ncbi:MAG: alpha-hydroxy acid oxidase [Castellaniella sp.]|uniref:alpha-hydroxy acid oxidase n=1 Tax=Castellaniella sp. TaxID=1955812 RepID=UPI003C74A12A
MTLRLNSADWRAAARAALPRFVFDYLDGAADDTLCLRRNRDDLDRVILTPRVLRDVSRLETGVEVFGRRWAQPFGIAPMGLNGLSWPGGDTVLAQAAAAHGLPFALSTASNARLEDLRAQAPSGIHWMQLYVMHRGLAEGIVERAARAGYEALVLTVDVPVGGNRELDIRHGFRVPFKPGARFLCDVMRHPRWAVRMARAGRFDFGNLRAEDAPGADSAGLQAALLTRAMDRSLTWDSLSWLRQFWKGPLLLKGVLHPDDARRALDHGADGLIVSNHGGRQSDASPSAIAALPGVVQAVGGRVPVLMDSGIRRGNDVIRALALGARAVLLGRPLLYGLAGSGQAGVESVLSQFEAELQRGMALLGLENLDDVPGSGLVNGPDLS